MGHIDNSGYYINSAREEPLKPMCFGTEVVHGCKESCKFGIECKGFQAKPCLERVS